MTFCVLQHLVRQDRILKQRFYNSDLHPENLSHIHSIRHTHHVIDVFEYVGESTDDQREFVSGDVDETFFIVLRADFGVCVLNANFNRKLQANKQTVYTPSREYITSFCFQFSRHLENAKLSLGYI